MDSNFIIRIPKMSVRFAQIVLILIFSLFINHSARAEIVELSITGYWSEKDFKVTKKLDQLYNPADPIFDGRVFGVDPSAGSVTLQPLVNTEGSIFFQKGSGFTAKGVGTYSLSHDFYGYRDVTLVGGTYSFGNAIWRSDGI
ncbi:MAG: hypothetical protein ABIV48_07335, partial [Pyrinomonadaceae bacterium]